MFRLVKITRSITERVGLTLIILTVLGIITACSKPSVGNNPTLTSYLADEGTIFQGEDYVGLVARCSNAGQSTPILDLVIQELESGVVVRAWLSDGPNARTIDPFRVVAEGQLYEAQAFRLELNNELGGETPAELKITIDQVDYQTTVFCR